MKRSDPRLEATMVVVDWNMVTSIASRLLEVSDCRCGIKLSGGFIVVRFLHMNDKNGIVQIVRIPYLPEEGWTAENSKLSADRLSSEVATMQYVSYENSCSSYHSS